MPVWLHLFTTALLLDAMELELEAAELLLRIDELELGGKETELLLRIDELLL
jgi:hypothetical protein